MLFMDEIILEAINGITLDLKPGDTYTMKAGEKILLHRDAEGNWVSK